MKNKPTLLTKTTLQRILTEFTTHNWSDQELDELVSPKYGIITSFQEIIEDSRKLAEIDFNAIEPAGTLPFSREHPWKTTI